MRSPELPALAALVIFSELLTLHTQIRMRNVPVLVAGAVITISGTVYLVNSLVWAGNVRDVAPIWCDIGTS
jgi:pheromone a factor receptor